jgi:hypothetical protein
MIANRNGRARTERVACTIEIENTFDSLHAHVALDGDVIVEPGDEVIVHGDPIHAAFGERIVVRREATIVRARPIERLLTKARAYLDITELYEVGFSAGRTS